MEKNIKGGKSVKKIVITGPESTGKSQLAQALAQHYQTAWVREYAREYLNENGPKYTFDDLHTIALGQIELEEKAMGQKPEIIFFDTNLLTIEIWSEFVFGKVDSRISNLHDTRSYDLYLLCDIDLPWEDDPLREHPEKRAELMQIYQQKLEKSSTPHQVISGIGKERYERAIQIIDSSY